MGGRKRRVEDIFMKRSRVYLAGYTGCIWTYDR